MAEGETEIDLGPERKCLWHILIEMFSWQVVLDLKRKGEDRPRIGKQ